jgi:hypothetical protein
MLDAQTCLQLLDHAGKPQSDVPSELSAASDAVVIVGFVGQYLIGFGSLWWLGT